MRVDPHIGEERVRVVGASRVHAIRVRVGVKHLEFLAHRRVAPANIDIDLWMRERRVSRGTQCTSAGARKEANEAKQSPIKNDSS